MQELLAENNLVITKADHQTIKYSPPTFPAMLDFFIP